jgi:hypothetical protein
VPGGRRRRRVRWHEVDDLAHTTRCLEAGDEDGGVGEVELTHGGLVPDIGGEAAGTAAVTVEQRGEHARGVEPG